MAKQMIKGLTMLMLVLVLSLVTSVVSANGQSSSRRVVSNIPFEFTVGDKDLPAGTYAIQPVSSGSEAMLISGTENNQSVARLSNTKTRLSSDKGKLVFHRYQNRYFLSEIWAPGAQDGRQLFKSNGERAIQRELASNAKPGEQRYERIEIAVLVRR